MSNAEVLRWLQQKRAQYASEDAQRPEDLLKSLERHERHLSSAAYPYQKNPSVYLDGKAEGAIHRFAEEHFKRIQQPLVDKYGRAIREKTMSKAAAQRKIKAEQDRKELSEAEMLMVYNLAPTCVELLQPCIEEVENRFTADELETLVDIIKQVFRADEVKASMGADVQMGVDQQMDEAPDAEVT